MACFSKELSETDFKKRLTVPTSFMEHLPPVVEGGTRELQVVDVGGKVWKFSYYTRRGGQYSKPVFQGEWIRFVRHKNLQAGDKITFSVDKNAVHHNPRFTIEAHKKGAFKLFGADVIGWGDPS